MFVWTYNSCNRGIWFLIFCVLLWIFELGIYIINLGKTWEKLQLATLLISFLAPYAFNHVNIQHLDYYLQLKNPWNIDLDWMIRQPIFLLVKSTLTPEVTLQTVWTRMILSSQSKTSSWLSFEFQIVNSSYRYMLRTKNWVKCKGYSG